MFSGHTFFHLEGRKRRSGQSGSSSERERRSGRRRRRSGRRRRPGSDWRTNANGEKRFDAQNK